MIISYSNYLKKKKYHLGRLNFIAIKRESKKKYSWDSMKRLMKTIWHIMFLIITRGIVPGQRLDPLAQSSV